MSEIELTLWSSRLSVFYTQRAMCSRVSASHYAELTPWGKLAVVELMLLAFCLRRLLHLWKLDRWMLWHTLPALFELSLQLCLYCLVPQELVIVRYHSPPQLLLCAVVRNLFLLAPLLHRCYR